MPNDPVIVQVDDQEHNATATERARIAAIREGNQNNIPGE